MHLKSQLHPHEVASETSETDIFISSGVKPKPPPWRGTSRPTQRTVPQSHSAKNARLSAEVRTRRLETKSETFSFSCRDVEHVVCAAASFKSHRFSHCAVKNHTVSRQLHCMFSSLLDVCGFPLSQRSLSLRRARGRSLNSAPRLLITPRAQTLFLCHSAAHNTLVCASEK